jgi:hypothetical protein
MIMSGEYTEQDLDESEEGKAKFKAFRLAQISREISAEVDDVFKNSAYADPLMPDNYH